MKFELSVCFGMASGFPSIQELAAARRTLRLFCTVHPALVRQG